jgi:hypothetical protein
MGWQSTEFGSSHDGMTGVLLDDGSEPGPLRFDGGSGGNFIESRDWAAVQRQVGQPPSGVRAGSMLMRVARREPPPPDHLGSRGSVSGRGRELP